MTLAGSPESRVDREVHLPEVHPRPQRVRHRRRDAEQRPQLPCDAAQQPLVVRDIAAFLLLNISALVMPLLMDSMHSAVSSTCLSCY